MKEQKTTNLLELLDTLDENAMVAIGAKKGGGYVYIGRAGDRDLISKVFDGFVKRAKRRISNSKGTLKTLVTKPVQLTGDDIKDNEAVTKRVRAIVENHVTLKRNTEYVGSYKEPFERTVIESYQKIWDDCLAIIVEGKEEQGCCWSKKEFDEMYR